MKMSCTDRFIGLPDEVTCHILSFLPTKYSAQTSLLAKSWRYLWSRVPSLEFKCRRRKLRGDFVHPNIIDRVLSHHEANISSFRLSYTHYDDYDDDTNTKLESWIATIITRNVSNLSLSLRDRIKLPRCLFTCETLVDLSLTCGEIPVGVAVYFPALKRLKLKDVDDYYESDESLPHLLSGCPVIEELNIHATDECVRCWCISLPTLTRLVLILEEKQRSFANHRKQKDFRVKLDTPALRYLRLSVSTAENVFVGTVLDSLIEADVAVYHPQWLREQNYLFHLRDSIEENLLYANSVKDILGVLYNVKFLTLTTDAMEVPDEDYWFPDSMGVKFHSLTKLNVLTSDWPLIISLLGNANHLRVLNILDVVQSRNNHVMEPKQVPSCLISHLQKVNMDSMMYPPIKLDIAKYILINAKVLKKMKMQVWTSDNNFEPLASIQTGSPTCKLVFI